VIVNENNSIYSIKMKLQNKIKINAYYLKLKYNNKILEDVNRFTTFLLPVDLIIERPNKLNSKLCSYKDLINW